MDNTLHLAEEKDLAGWWCDAGGKRAISSFRRGDGRSRGPLGYRLFVRLLFTVAGLRAGDSVRDRGAAGFQRRVRGRRRGGVAPPVGDRGLRGALAAQALDLLVEFIALRFERPPQLFQPLHFPLQGFKLTVLHRFLDRKETQTSSVVILPGGGGRHPSKRTSSDISRRALLLLSHRDRYMAVSFSSFLIFLVIWIKA